MTAILTSTFDVWCPHCKEHDKVPSITRQHECEKCGKQTKVGDGFWIRCRNTKCSNVADHCGGGTDSHKCSKCEEECRYWYLKGKPEHPDLYSPLFLYNKTRSNLRPLSHMVTTATVQTVVGNRILRECLHLYSGLWLRCCKGIPAHAVITIGLFFQCAYNSQWRFSILFGVPGVVCVLD